MNNTAKHSPFSELLNFMKKGGFFLILVAALVYVLVKGDSLPLIFSALKLANKLYIFAAAVCMCLFVYCEGANIRRCLSLFGYRESRFHGIKYALVGFFYSSITPSATGGQPMQVYYMHRDGISLSHAALSLLIELSSFQTVTVFFALAGYLLRRNLLESSIGGLRYLLLLGLGLNMTVLTLILICIFSKKLSTVLLNFACRVVRRFAPSKFEKVRNSLVATIGEYQESAAYFWQNKTAMLKILLTTALQITGYHAIPFLIYRAFGLSGADAVSIISMQAVLYITVSALPLPGAVGISESGFLILFSAFFPQNLLSAAMLLSRGVSFYLFVAISGTFVAALELIRMLKKSGSENKTKDGRS